MATGTPRTRWNGNLSHPFPDNTESSLALHLSYEGKVAESDVLAIEPATLQPLQIKEDSANTLYYGDNLPILAALMQNPEIKGKVRLIYIDPPFATNSVFQSRTQGDAYHDLLVGAHYIEFLRERLIFLRELLSKDGSIYIHLDENMAFHIKVIMDELFGKGNFRNWITRKGKPWRGKLPPPGKHWQFPPQTLDEMDARGEIYWSPTGNPRRKIYFDGSAGIPIQDIWLEFRDAHNQNIKITGYPTEKIPPCSLA